MGIATSPFLRRFRAASAATLICLVSGIAPLAAEDFDLSVHLAVMGLKEARAPFVVNGSIIFSSAEKAWHVGVAFRHEGYGTMHSMQRNQHGVLFLAYPVPVGMKDPLAYRMVRDGLWQRDPLNPLFERDESGAILISLYHAPWIDPERPGHALVWDAEKRVAHFKYRGEAGRIVSVAGTFNNWDPFLYELEEVSEGRYELDLPLPEGEWIYAFIVDGTKVVDERNPLMLYDASGNPVSKIVVKL